MRPLFGGILGALLFAGCTLILGTTVPSPRSHKGRTRSDSYAFASPPLFGRPFFSLR